MAKHSLGKRPCSICRQWFQPDVHQKGRQKTCGNPDCKREQHRRQCEKWNRKNRDYFKTNYLESIGISIFNLAYQIVVAVMVLNVSKKDTLCICHQTKKLIRRLSGRFLLIIGNHSKSIIQGMIIRNMKIRFRKCLVAARKAPDIASTGVFIAVVMKRL